MNYKVMPSKKVITSLYKGFRKDIISGWGIITRAIKGFFKVPACLRHSFPVFEGGRVHWIAAPTWAAVTYPLDKHLITIVKVAMKESGWQAEEEATDCSGHRIRFSKGVIDVSVYFSPNAGPSTCNLVKIGSKRVERVESIYEMQCKEAVDG